METYLTLPTLKDYALEESWVLGIEVKPGVVELIVDLCFAATHPELRPLRDGEWTYFRRGVIRFAGVTAVTWRNMGRPAATDASGAKDWGHIDSLEWDETSFTLEGDFGAMCLTAATVTVELTGPA
ncbi:hypothetical protein [Herbiconiux solani]|uniref:hypothetical protein n=1 Tax=Herbiconiux solani TaxID=661329 RepID=UPI0008265EBB|nr:hypothetical protein [Herbiconiux solani]